MLRQLADDVEVPRPKVAFTRVAAMSESEFWRLTEPYGWGTRTTDYKKIKKDLMRKLTPEQATELSDAFWKLRGPLANALDPVVGIGGDSFDDLVSHIIGLGRREYQAVMRNPELAVARAHAPYGSKEGYTESFSYALPSKYDYEHLNINAFLKWAERNLRDYKAVLEADEDEVPFKNKITPPLRFLVDAFTDFIRTKDAYRFLELEDRIKKASEAVDNALSRMGFGMSLPEEGTLEAALKTVSNKWATWNLLSDIRDTLLD